MSRRRVVVTGMGIVSPVGIGLAAAWDAISRPAPASGRSRGSTLDVPIAVRGEVKDFDVGKYMSAKEARRYDAFTHYGLVATMEAVADAGLTDYAGDKERVGVCIGSGIGGLPMIEETKKHYLEGGPRKISPFFVPGPSSTWCQAWCRSTTASGDRTSRWSAPAPPPTTASVSGPHHQIRRRRRDGRRRRRSDGKPARRRRLLRDASAVAPQRRSRGRQSAVGHRPRRLRPGRGRRRAGARGIRARQGARRADLLRARRLWHERRRASHHRAARGWRGAARAWRMR